MRIAKKELLPAALVVLVLLLLLFFACAIIAVLILFPGSQPAPPTPGPPANVSGPNISVNISGNGTALWDSITNANVEVACLSAAKDTAGSNAWAVQACTCAETVNGATKHYECDIATLDPSGTRYFARINCVLAARVCTIESNYGTQSFTFDELAAMYS